MVHGIPVHRFKVAVERNPVEFAKWSEKVFAKKHSLRDELAWLDAEGPTSPALVEYIRAHEADYDFFIFFSFRYHHSFHGARAVASKAILVPTAERDGALGLGLYPPLFRGVRAFMYNSYEERALIQGVAKNESVPGVVVGVGSEIPERSNPGRFRQKHNIRDRFAIYVGRIDENKGCVELFDFFEHYSASLVDGMHLVLIGTAHVPIPKHPRIHHVGFVEDAGQVRRDGRRRTADHALVSREPVDGRARSLGDGKARARQCQVRRPPGPVPAQQRRVVLCELSGVRGNIARDRHDAEPAGGARPQWPDVLRTPLRVAGDRQEVRRHAAAAVEDAGAEHDGADAGLVDAAAGEPAARGFDCQAVAGRSVSRRATSRRPPAGGEVATAGQRRSAAAAVAAAGAQARLSPAAAGARARVPTAAAGARDRCSTATTGAQRQGQARSRPRSAAAASSPRPAARRPGGR